MAQRSEILLFFIVQKGLILKATPYLVMAGSTPMQAETVKVLKEERIPPSEMEKVLSEFLKRKHVYDRVSKKDLTRLKALRDTLEEEQRAGST